MAKIYGKNYLETVFNILKINVKLISIFIFYNKLPHNVIKQCIAQVSPDENQSIGKMQLILEALKVLVTQSCPMLWNPWTSLPVFSVHGSSKGELD